MTLALYGTSGRRRAALLFAALVAMAVAISAGAGALTSALATTPHVTLTGNAVCAEDSSSWSIGWQAANSSSSGAMSISVNSITSPLSNPAFAPNPVPTSQSASATSSGIPITLSAATLSIKGTWGSSHDDDSKTVDRPANCGGEIQVHKYMPKNDPPENAPWQNQGNGQGAWLFRVYADQAMTQPLGGTFHQLGPNSAKGSGTVYPENIDLWIAETNTDGDVFAGFWFPDGSAEGEGSSGNAFCNQQPLDGSTLSHAVPTKIPAGYWGTHGDASGILHICAYNEPPKAKIIVKKVVTGTGADPATGFTADINNTNGSEGDLDNLAFSQNVPGSETFTAEAAGHDDYQVTEDVPPANWALTGKKVLSGDATCPTSGWDSASNSHRTASGGALDNVGNGDTVTVCFKNTYTEPLKAKIIVKKVVTGTGADPATGFTADIDNTTSSSQGDLSNLPFSQNTPGVDVFDDEGDPDSFSVTEDVPPALWAITGTKVLVGDVSCTGTEPWVLADNAHRAASGGALSDVGNGDTVTVCFKNEYAPPATVTINATKIVCDSETDLPAFPYADITSTTAADFDGAHANCTRTAGWSFEWGFGQAPGPVAVKQPGSSVGPVAPNSGWNAFTGGSSDTYQTATVALGSHSGEDAIWVREVLKAGYLPFTDDSSANPSYSAQLACHTDGVNYDNYDSIDFPVAGGTYYCVAWNVAVRHVTIKKVVTNVDNDPTRFAIEQDALTEPIGAISEAGGTGGSPEVIQTLVDGGPHTFREGVVSGYSYIGKEILTGSDGSCTGSHDTPIGGPTIPAGSGDLTICVYNQKDGGTLHWFKFVDSVASNSANAYTINVDGEALGNTAISGFGTPGSWVTKWLSPGVHTLSESVPPTGYVFDKGRCVLGGDEMDIDATVPGNQYFWGPGTADAESDGSPTFDLPDVPGPANGSINVNTGDDIYCVLYNIGVGTIRITKIDMTVPTDLTRPIDGDWDFSIAGPAGSDTSATISPLNSGAVTTKSITLSNQPVGAYSITESDAGLGSLTACPVSNPDGQQYFTTVIPPSTTTLAAGQMLEWVFRNEPCPTQLGEGGLVLRKFEDLNGNGVQDAGEVGIPNWAFTVSGPDFPGGTTVYTDAAGVYGFVGVGEGQYTVAETMQPGYKAIGLRVNLGSLQVGAMTTEVNVPYAQTAVVDFYNEPFGTLTISKTTLTNGTADANNDGWAMSASSAACGITLGPALTAGGAVKFSKIPACSDYIVSENASNSLGYQASGPTTLTGIAVTVNATTTVGFTNVRTFFIPFCVGAECNPPTPTPVTPTVTPPTPTPIPPTATPTPIEVVLGEKTPGPGIEATPIAPSTGTGETVGGESTNIAFGLLGLVTASAGFGLMALGRRRGR